MVFKSEAKTRGLVRKSRMIDYLSTWRTSKWPTIGMPLTDKLFEKQSIISWRLILCIENRLRDWNLTRLLFFEAFATT